MKKMYAALLIVILGGTFCSGKEIADGNNPLSSPPSSSANVNYAKPFEPPTRPVFIALPLGAVEPIGWLRDWCLAARDGYTGHLAQMDIAFQQAWAEDYKMTGENLFWEKGGWPYEGGGYWFDGMVRLGAVLHDEFLQNQAKERLDVVVKNMHPDSILFLWWLNKNDPNQLKVGEGRWMREKEWSMCACGFLGRALVAQYSAAKDPAVLKALEMAYTGNREWVSMGWAMSNFMPAYETWTWTGNKEIAAAIDQLIAENAGNRNPYYNMPWLNSATGLIFHGVHFCESMSPWAIGYLWTGDQKYIQVPLKWIDLIEQDSLQPSGVPVFDEMNGPTGAFRATETCNVSGYQWSLLTLLAVSGKGSLADRVERAFFNAGPAAVGRDFKSHVYFQTPNRMADKELPHSIRCTYQSVHQPLCCTASLSRFLPNYISKMWMATYDNGLAATLYGPCKVTALAGDRVSVELTCRTDYPFNENIEIAVSPAREAAFPLRFRIPVWCSSPKVFVNNQAMATEPLENGFIRIERTWKQADTIRLMFPMKPQVVCGYDRNDYEPQKDDHSTRTYSGKKAVPYASVSYGPLLFALPIADTNDYNTPDPDARWNYALDRQDSAGRSIAVEREPMPAKWDWPLASPVRLRVQALPFDWKPTLEQPLPQMPLAEKTKSQTITLIPYGCTKFRISMFPVTQQLWEQCQPKEKQGSQADKNMSK